METRNNGTKRQKTHHVDPSTKLTLRNKQEESKQNPEKRAVIIKFLDMEGKETGDEI
jgi:ribosome assembly protein 4